MRKIFFMSKEKNAEAVRWLAGYLEVTRDKGTILEPVKDENIVGYVDANFSGIETLRNTPTITQLDIDTDI